MPLIFVVVRVVVALAPGTVVARWTEGRQRRTSLTVIIPAAVCEVRPVAVTAVVVIHVIMFSMVLRMAVVVSEVATPPVVVVAVLVIHSSVFRVVPGVVIVVP